MSDCRDTNAVLGCYNDGVTPVTVIVTHVHDYKGAPAAIITNLAGVVVAGATLANTTLGACALALPSTTTEFNELYDVQPDGTFTRFIRRTVASTTAAGVTTVTITNLAMDYTTPYAPTGTITQDMSCAALTSRGLQTTW